MCMYLYGGHTDTKHEVKEIRRKQTEKQFEV